MPVNVSLIFLPNSCGAGYYYSQSIYDVAQVLARYNPDEILQQAHILFH